MTLVKLIKLIEIHVDTFSSVRCCFIADLGLHGGTGFLEAIHTPGEPVVTASEK